MIQRIQTVYLTLVLVLSVLGLCSWVGQYYNGADLVAEFDEFSFSHAKGFKDVVEGATTFALAVLHIAVAIITLLAIMLFRMRMRQMRMVIVSSLLLVGYIVLYVLYALKFQWQLETVPGMECVSYHLTVAALYPVLSFILNAMAIHCIRRDEALVRSLDRLR